MKIRKGPPSASDSALGRRRRWGGAITAGLLCANALCVVHAQGGDTRGPVRTLPAISVTTTDAPDIAKDSSVAGKADTPLIETPQSISVVTREQLTQQNAITVGQALRYTPGVVAEWRGQSSGKYDHILVRGSAGYTVDTFWDGLKIPSIGSLGGPNPDPYFLERVEVLRGPSSVLYGQGLANGLVHLISKRPAEEAFGETRLTFGSNDYRQVGIDVGGPVDSGGRLLYRLTAVGLDTASPVDHVEEARLGIAPALTWRLGAGTSLTLLGSYQRDPDLGYYDTRPAIGTAFRNPLGQVPTGFYAGEPAVDDNHRKYTAVGYTLEHRFDDRWRVQQNLRYVDADFNFEEVAFQSLRADNRTANRYASHFTREGHGLALDNQLHAHLATGAWDHTLLLGVDYLEEDANSINYAGTAAPIDLYAPVYGGTVNLAPTPRSSANQKPKQTGIYLQDQLRHGAWTILLGGRHDHASSTMTNYLTRAVGTMSDDAWTGRAGVVYQVRPGVAPYVSYAQSFQPVAGFDASGRPFEPSRGEQWEVGIKLQPASGSALVTLGAFDLVEDNLSTPDHNNVGFNTQLGEVRSRGLELEARFVAWQQLSVTAAYAYLDNEITSGTPAEVGKSRPNAPKHSASAWAEYRFIAPALQNLGIGAGLRYVGPSPANTVSGAGYFEAPSSTLADLALHYEFAASARVLHGLRVDVNIKNVFDRDYVGSCGGNSPSAGYCWAGYPRTLTASASYRW